MTALTTHDPRQDNAPMVEPAGSALRAGGVRPGIAYVGASLPSRSETFVYRELLGLRGRGWDVTPVSVHAPQRGLGEPELDALADEAVTVYAGGGAALVVDALRQCVAAPARSIRTLWRGQLDALFGADVPLRARPKVLVQCVAGLALAHRLRGRGVGWLHAHMAHVPTTIAMYAARAMGVGFSFTGHAADLTRDRCLLKQKLRRAGFAPCISRWHQGFYQDEAPADDTASARPVVRCAVDLAQFAPVAPVPGDMLRLLSVGRLVPKKGFDVLIDAVAQTPGVRATIVGDGPERAALEQQVARLGVSDRVDMVGAKDNVAVRAMLGEADAFVLPCRVARSGDRDGIPVVLMEAMASGLPVVSGDLPTIRELVAHDRTGLLIDPEDPAALPAALARLRDDAALRTRLASAGRQHVEDEFSMHVNLDRLEQALCRVLGVAATQDAIPAHAGRGAA